MAGRPRKALGLATGKIGKQEKLNRQVQEEKLKLDRDELNPPEWLSEFGQEEFSRVVEECEKIDLLDNLDISVLAIYCNAYASYVEINEIMSKKPKKSRYTDNGKIDPLVNAQDKFVKQIMSCSSKLGLATTDRLKLIVPTKTESETNKYLKYV